MREIVADAFENAPDVPGANDYYRTGISLRQRLNHTREVVIPMFQKAVEKGVRWTVGMDSMHGLIGFEIGSLVEWGLSPLEAIVGATKQAAEVCGVAHDCGTLEAGKRADIISVRGNILEDIWAIARPNLLMKAGTRYDHISVF